MRKLFLCVSMLASVVALAISAQAADPAPSFVIQGVQYNDGTNPNAYQDYPGKGATSGRIQIPYVASQSPIIIYGYYTPPAGSTILNGTVRTSGSGGYSPAQTPTQAQDGSGGWRITIAAESFPQNCVITLSTSYSSKPDQMLVANTIVTTIEQTLVIGNNPQSSGGQ